MDFPVDKIFKPKAKSKWNRIPKKGSPSQWTRSQAYDKFSKISFPKTNGRVMLLKNKGYYYFHRDGRVLAFVSVPDFQVDHAELLIAILNREPLTDNQWRYACKLSYNLGKQKMLS